MVHEALISHWTRLKDWLLQNQEGQRTLLALRQAATIGKTVPNVSLLWTGICSKSYAILNGCPIFNRPPESQLLWLVNLALRNR